MYLKGKFSSNCQNFPPSSNHFFSRNEHPLSQLFPLMLQLPMRLGQLPDSNHNSCPGGKHQIHSPWTPYSREFTILPNMCTKITFWEFRCLLLPIFQWSNQLVCSFILFFTHKFSLQLTTIPFFDIGSSSHLPLKSQAYQRITTHQNVRSLLSKLLGCMFWGYWFPCSLWGVF